MIRTDLTDVAGAQPIPALDEALSAAEIRDRMVGLGP